MCSLNAPHRVTAFPSRRHSLGLFLWDLQSDIWKSIEGYGEKGNFFRLKLERRFLRNCYLFC
ncbi:nef attachable domain protein [Chlamydia psittaci 02DC14]|nr:nef attachable domain protein [Chlamydia psittaci 02DC14]